MNSHNIIFPSLCTKLHISRSWQLASLFSGRQVVVGGVDDGGNYLASVEVFPRKVGCNIIYSQYVMIMIKIVMIMIMTVIMLTMKNLLTQGWLQDTGSPTGEEWCKRLPPSRFYIPLLFWNLTSSPPRQWACCLWRDRCYDLVWGLAAWPGGVDYFCGDEVSFLFWSLIIMGGLLMIIMGGLVESHHRDNNDVCCLINLLPLITSTIVITTTIHDHYQHDRFSRACSSSSSSS